MGACQSAVVPRKAEDYDRNINLIIGPIKATDSSRGAHNPEVAGSSPAPATQFLETANIQSCAVSCCILEVNKRKMLKLYILR